MLYSPSPENKACNKAALSLVKAALWPFFHIGTTCMQCMQCSHVLLAAPGVTFVVKVSLGHKQILAWV
jgi:hypothetical protein